MDETAVASVPTAERTPGAGQGGLVGRDPERALIDGLLDGPAQGGTHVEAAASLFLSRKTIEARLTGVYRELGVRSRPDLVCSLARSGLVR